MNEKIEIYKHIYQDSEMSLSSLENLKNDLKNKDNKIKDILDDIITNYAQSTKEIIIGEEKVSVLDANFNDLLEINSDTVRMAYCKFN